MKHNFESFAATLLCTALSICGCHPANPSGKSETAQVSLYIENPDGTKSSLNSSDESFPEEVILLVYDDKGQLVRSVSPDRQLNDSDNTVAIDDIILGKDYYIYALAGMELTASDLRGLSDMSAVGNLQLSYYDFNSRGQMVYSHIPQHPVRFEKNGNYPIGLKRIVAKYNFIIDKSLMEGNFTVEDIVIRQSPWITYPLAEECRGSYYWDMSEGDRATVDDLTAINEGGAAHLYAFENLQGDALVGNENPWEKVPDRLIGMTGDVASFVEIAGLYEGEGITIRPLTYRFILGEDNVSNCDVRRNTVHTVTLVLTDENAIVKESWKLDRGVVDDRRVASFSTDRLDIYPYAGRSDTVGIAIYPAEMEYSVSLDSTMLDDYPFNVIQDGQSLILNSRRFLEQSYTTEYYPIYLTTADSNVGDILTVSYSTLDRITIIQPEGLYYNFDGYAKNEDYDIITLMSHTGRNRNDASECLRVILDYNGTRKTTADTLFERGLEIESESPGIISAERSSTNPTLWCLTAKSAGNARITASYTLWGETISGTAFLGTQEVQMTLNAAGSIRTGQSCAPYVTMRCNDMDLHPIEEYLTITSSDREILSDNGLGISAGTARLEARYTGLNLEKVLTAVKQVTVAP